MEENHHSCANSPDRFCYVCGQYIVKSQCHSITGRFKVAYFHYFGCHIGNQNKKWAPHVCCITCYVNLIEWLKGNKKCMQFAVPMVWREPTSHIEDCYFCLTKTGSFSKKKKSKVEYPNVPSALRPVPHGEGLPVPEPPSECENLHDSDEDSEEKKMTETLFSDLSYIPKVHGEPHLIKDHELNDLARDLSLSKEKVELLAARLQHWNLLAGSPRVCIQKEK